MHTNTLLTSKYITNKYTFNTINISHTIYRQNVYDDNN